MHHKEHGETTQMDRLTLSLSPGTKHPPRDNYHEKPLPLPGPPCWSRANRSEDDRHVESPLVSRC